MLVGPWTRNPRAPCSQRGSVERWSGALWCAAVIPSGGGWHWFVSAPRTAASIEGFEHDRDTAKRVADNHLRLLGCVVWDAPHGYDASATEEEEPDVSPSP